MIFKLSPFVVTLIVASMTGLIVAMGHHQVPHEPGYAHHYNPYNFGYDVEDYHGNKQWRSERSHSPHEVHGSYGYKDHNGVYREVVYVADKNGFRANIKSNEPGLAGSKESAGVKLDSHHVEPTTVYSSYSPLPPTYYSRNYHHKKQL